MTLIPQHKRIVMLIANISNCASLEDFYKSIRMQQEKAHGDFYCQHHDMIKKYMVRGDKYKELGVYQGASAAAACLIFPSEVELIDLSLELFNENKHLFIEYCNRNNITLVAKEMSSINTKSQSMADILLIDSYHKAYHLKQELEIHSKFTRKFMIFHDTSIRKGELFIYLKEFVNNESAWRIEERGMIGQGYTVLKRIYA